MKTHRIFIACQAMAVGEAALQIVNIRLCQEGLGATPG
jgi:hypothetical protein